MLAVAGASTVVGVDVDAAIVEHATARYGPHFRVGDVSALPVGDDEMDLVVSFETIEHVPEPERALEEFRRVLQPDGLLLVSTPNAQEYLEDNPFHLREFSSEEFLALLRERFAHVRPLYQQNFLSSALLDEDDLRLEDPERALELEVRKVAGAPPGRELYTLALCGDGPLPPLDTRLAVLSGVYEAHRLASLLREATEHVRRWHERSSEAERIQREWEARATRAEANRDAWEERATEAERVQREWGARAAEAERLNEELRETLGRIERSLSWRLTKPLRAAKRRGSR
jgi:SAM-dependent methyltransferase